MSRAWMQELCGVPTSKIGKPFAVEIDGVSWDCATTGTLLLMLRGPCEFPVLGERPPIEKSIDSPLGEPHTVAFSALIDWAYTPKIEARGNLLGVGFNRRLVWEGLRLPPRVESVVLRSGGEKGPTLIDAGDWRLYVAPLRDQITDPSVPSFPVGGVR